MPTSIKKSTAEERVSKLDLAYFGRIGFAGYGKNI